MKISEFFKLGINPATSYILGLSFPLLKVKDLGNGYYILGSVNHNANMITDPEITMHFMEVSKLLSIHLSSKLDKILVYNHSPIYGIIQPKLGFSVVLQLDDDNYLERMRMMVMELKKAPENCRVQFVRGCFDGRSSFDTSRHYLSLDVDRDHQKQNLIVSIIGSLGINVDLNQRDKDHPKNDQIRIVPQNLRLYMTKVGFYSVRREEIISNYLNK